MALKTSPKLRWSQFGCAAAVAAAAAAASAAAAAAAQFYG
jgi:hypothetical protein